MWRLSCRTTTPRSACASLWCPAGTSRCAPWCPPRRPPPCACRSAPRPRRRRRRRDAAPRAEPGTRSTRSAWTSRARNSPPRTKARRASTWTPRRPGRPARPSPSRSRRAKRDATRQDPPSGKGARTPRSSARRERIGFASIERLRAGRGHVVRARARTSDLHAPFASVGLRDLPRDAPRRANKCLCQSRIFRRATAGSARAASPNRRGRWAAHLRVSSSDAVAAETTVGVNGSVARARAELLRRLPSSAREGPPERLVSRSRAPCVA